MASIALRLPVMSVGPDAASHQVYYDAVDCVFSSYTYTNYGNFTLTITTGANSTFVITVPANPYSEARTAGADIIFYDTDGNSYTQTIKVGQEGNAPSPNILIKAEYVTNTVSHEIRIVDRWNAFYDIQFPVGTSIYNDVMGTSGAYTFPSNSYYEVYFYTSATTFSSGPGDGVFENIIHLTKVEVINGTEKKLQDFGDKAFNECTRLESAVLADSITRFGIYTFGGCDSLTGLTLPSCLTEMNYGWAGWGDSGCPLLTTIIANPSVAPKGYPTTRYMPNFRNVGSSGTLSYHYTEKISLSAVDMYDEWLVPDSQYANYASLGDKGWSGSYITEIALEESYVAVESGATQVRIPVYEVGCTYSNFTYSVSGVQDIQVALVPGTTHNYDLLLTIPASRSTAATTTDIDITFTDTNGNTYTGSSVCGDHTLSIEQAAMASGTFILFANNQVTFNAIEDPYAGIIYSSCTIDTSRFDIVSVVGDFVIDAEYCKIVRNGTTIHVPSGNDYYFVFTADHTNKTAADLSSDITVRFYDTSGNTYIDTVTVTQTANFWVEFEPEYYVMYGNSGQVCSNLVYTNCHPGTEGYNLVAVEKSTEESPDLSYTYTGNTLCVDVPENTTEEEWFYTFAFSGCIIANEGFSGSSIYNNQETGWTCMNYNPDASMRNFILVQYPAGTPQDKDIRIDNANFNIGSGSSSTSSTVTVEGTGLSGWTYTTGGSFAVTATTGANNTIVFNVPQNDTNSARTGYVYITFTDTEGNTYQQTITFYQDAGTSSFDFELKWYDTVISGSNNQDINMITARAKYPAAENSGNPVFQVTKTGNVISDFTVSSRTVSQGTIYDKYGFTVTGNGESTVTVRETNSGAEHSLKVYRNPSGSKQMYLSPSAITVGSESSVTFISAITQNCEFDDLLAGNQEYYIVEENNWPLRNPGQEWDITYLPIFLYGFTGDTGSLYIKENTSANTRSITQRYPLLSTSGELFLSDLSTEQAAGSSAKTIHLDPAALVAQSGDTAICAELKAENCTFSSYTLTESGGTHFTSGPTLSGNNMCFTFPANPSGTNRSETFFFVFYDTDGNHYNQFFVVQQLASGETQNVPEPWNKEGDTAYTWYSDELLLNIMPSQRELSWNERTAYYPVTAHTFGTFEVRASGDCPFIYTITAETDTSFNSHSLYCHTENNSGETQLTSQIKIVAYSGDSAYSATTMLLKDPEASGWITATPDRINASSSASSVNVYLTITNCQRSLDDEAINNDEFNRAEWVTVTLVNNTALTFNFAANMTPTTRSTYYNVCGRDHNDRLISRRVEITQASGTTGIKIIPDRTTLPKAAGSFTARVESTEAGNFSFSASPWMSITSYVPSSEKGGTLYINYSLNSGTTDRTGDIYASQQISTEPFTLTASTSVTQIASAETAYITITPPTVGVGRQAGTVEAQVNYAGLATPPAIVRDAGNMSIVSYNLDSGLITVAYGANDTTVPKNQTFLVTATTLGGQNISASFTITQGGAGQAVAPIWRDYVIDLPTPGQGYINYYISYDGTVVYTGRAYSMGQTNLEIYYNHLCKSFLSNRIDFTSGFQTVTDWLGNFTISSPELGNIASVNFFEDYSYENRHMTNTMTLNNPIINEVVVGGFVPFSFFVTGLSGEVSIMENGAPATSFTISDNEQHRYFITAEQGKTYEALGTRYKAISACDARYSLYYVNSYGGVDVLPFKGRSFKKTDNITRLNYSRSFRNNTLEFENVNYMNEIKPAWELNTSFMTDEQSKKMHELVESTIVYLYDAEEQTYTPVVMTDKKLEYKTYFNQGRKFYTYTVNVEESQSKERR